ncbi:polysaccharide pyruvyl transferase family protein [Janthinobacterium sp. LM6]|uniref:polysaccharide pyruvyl transferase family protein n=1 Tax=Janthinobacterium sp. LM6 TaxID=1938606 RepID=UPI0012374E67|nr:polysaccharide pyruvyl transferase family protein [Janthinobacterium sp. LM6]
MNIFMVRPTTRNIGNDLIGYATAELLYEVFGAATNVVSIPALKGPQFGGLVPRQIYDMNRLADAVIVGGGNLFENGQLSYDVQAVNALRRPMMLMGLSHGRITGRDGQMEDRTDALSPTAIRHLVEHAKVAMVRDTGSQEILADLGAKVTVGGCPTLYLPPNAEGEAAKGGVIISVRHPMRMSVPATLQWRIAEDLRRLIAALRAEYAQPVYLACHDYIDLEFAAGFPEAAPLYFDEVSRYIEALRTCKLHVSYRLHGFLPCLAMGSHSINLSYDERGRSMLSTIGMASWDVDLMQSGDCVSAIMDRARSVAQYRRARQDALPLIQELRQITVRGLQTLRTLASEQ